MSDSANAPWVFHYDAASCNGCDIEVVAAISPLFGVEHSSVAYTDSPEEADLFLVTGSVNERQIPIIRQLYEQMLEPKVVVACGTCACSGGVFKECYNTLGGVDHAIPVDFYAPGCAIRPESIIDAVVAGLDLLEEKRALLAADALESAELPKLPRAADKIVDAEGKSVADAWRESIAEAHEPSEASDPPERR